MHRDVRARFLPLRRVTAADFSSPEEESKMANRYKACKRDVERAGPHSALRCA